jgi:hypothetical protein
MRKWVSLLIGAALLFGLHSNLFAEKSVLIDFDKLKANGNLVSQGEQTTIQAVTADDAGYKDFKNHGWQQHVPTMISYGDIAGSSFTDGDKGKMKTSLAPGNWEIEINSSASTVENKRYSKTKEWHTLKVNVLADASGDKQADGYTILGIRIHFPESNFNNWALIKPPFEIPAYDDLRTTFDGKDETPENIKKNQGTKFENGYGVIKNVGIIKSIDIRVYGCQFKNSIAVLLKDDKSVTTEYDMPQYLDFDGWKKITWVNPNYIDDAANRTLYVVPLYPHTMPYIKLAGFRLYRQGDQYGGDFVTYVKDVTITYDKAVLDDKKIIDHEEAWGILAQRTQEAKKREFSKIGQSQILKFLERQKMHKEEAPKQ